MSIGRYEAFWAGTDARPLYAAVHPSAAPAGGLGVLCVPPLLHEQPRSRRFVTEVASGLAARGIACLRFDFAGTGDSPGGGDSDFETLADDLSLALDALRARPGVERVAVLALRGAALPVAAWLGGNAAVERVVLWEPVDDGAAWLSELERSDREERATRPRTRPGVPRSAPTDDGQLMGFAASPGLRRDLAGARLPSYLPGGVPAWGVLRRDAQTPVALQRRFDLPDGAPTFGGGAGMESAVFLSPALERVVDELGLGLLACEPEVA